MENNVADGKSVRLSKAAGWIAVGMGVVHVVVAGWERRDLWSQVVEDGVWNTFTLDKSVTLSQFERAEGFWTTFGSFGVPVLVFGCYVVWSTRRHQRVPGWLGWIFLAWGVPLVILCPASPGWAFPIIGGLLIAGDKSQSLAGQRPSAMAATGTTAGDLPRNPPSTRPPRRK
ncbi:DUF6463 family protein [Thermomonospora umbrina]|uniref:Uncharacterized protein n=1 Tax=Thermomonospora umbrina TaxID=111806 RepID=A0A3D9SYV5_9ACTN|nr:DUF6463 family protein [Thermomonospora umbrina]REF00768.1 hypothetical protein DFJ69_6349 [Thermomonospora umbrina]